MSEYIHRSHNVTVLIYHLVFPAKYRRVVFDEGVDGVLKSVCLEIAERYQIKFLEIGTDKDHVHFLVQSVPTYSRLKKIAGSEREFVNGRGMSKMVREAIDNYLKDHCSSIE